MYLYQLYHKTRWVDGYNILLNGFNSWYFYIYLDNLIVAPLLVDDAIIPLFLQGITALD